VTADKQVLSTHKRQDNSRLVNALTNSSRDLLEIRTAPLAEAHSSTSMACLPACLPQANSLGNSLGHARVCVMEGHLHGVTREFVLDIAWSHATSKPTTNPACTTAT
jgi:hypothetical protein